MEVIVVVIAAEDEEDEADEDEEDGVTDNTATRKTSRIFYASLG